MSKEELLALLQSVKTEMDIPEDFKCLGPIWNIYPALSEYERLWIYENADGIRIAVCDHGNCHCSFHSFGSEEEIRTALAA